MSVLPGFSLDEVMAAIGPGVRARENKRLLVYLHVPFCTSKCHFCDWVVGIETGSLTSGEAMRDRYADALVTQIEAWGPRLTELGHRATNVYWGGGTPTRLSAAQLARVLGALGRSFDLASVHEHTLECSPETLDEEKLDVLRRGGLNRLSVGVQSFDDVVLRRMGRAHDGEQAARAVTLARAAGIRNVNVDLIAGFPEQSSATLLASVERALALEVPHVSLYVFRAVSSDLVAVRQLKKGHRRAAAHDATLEAVREATRRLEAAGYEEYGRGYFAKGREHRFDGERYYFGFGGDYVGFGAGALSSLGRMFLRRSPDLSRYATIDLDGYLAAPTRMDAMVPFAMLPPEVLIATSLDNALSLEEGIDVACFADQFGYPFSVVRESPSFAAYVDALRGYGAEFIDTAERFALTPATRVSALLQKHVDEKAPAPSPV